MSTPVFEDKESIFFVGGRGDRSGRTAYAGGCTRQWWDSRCPGGTDAEKTAAMARLMGGSGAPVIVQSEAAYTVANNRITSVGAFTGAESGMVAFVIESDVPDTNVETGRYEITDVDPGGDWIECGGIDGDGDTDVDVYVGGAFDTLQNALDETDAGLHSVTIHTNLSETLSGSVNVDSGGDVPRNTFKRIIGFNTVPGDMSRGGECFESALEILAGGSIDANGCVLLDADGGSYAVLDFSGADNVIVENLHLANTGTSGDAVGFSSVCRNIVFRNCRFSGVKSVINSEADHVLFEGCYSGDDISGHQYTVWGHNNVLSGCVGRMASGTNLCNFVSCAGVVVGCVAVGGQFAVRAVGSGAAVLVMDNTFYETTSRAVICDGSDGVVVVGNIFCLSPGATGIYVRSGGSVVYNDYNCFIESDGTAPAATGSEYGGGEAPVTGAHSIEADPDFVDAANGDFRVRNPAVLRGGRPGPDGRAQVMGAIGQEYQFAKRSRLMNAGRMTILR